MVEKIFFDKNCFLFSFNFSFFSLVEKVRKVVGLVGGLLQFRLRSKHKI